MKNFSNSYQKFVLGLDEINQAIKKYPNEFIHDIEQSYNNEIEKTVDYILNLKKKRTIVMISGPSASGKTTTALLIKNKLLKMGAGASIISLDNFYKDRSKYSPINDNEIVDYESPEALDIENFKQCMTSLMKNGFCDIPKFNFITKGPDPDKIHIELKDGEVAIIEGIHGLNPVFTKNLPEDSIVRIYISVKQGINDYNGQIISNRHIRLIRRLVRDYEQRKSDPQNTIMMWKNVCKGQTSFIYPFKRTSDITINSIHLYELGAMKEIAVSLLSQITEDSPIFETSLILKSTLERFESTNINNVPYNSLIREFIGGGIYT